MTSEDDKAKSEGEQIAWRLRVDDFMADAEIQRRITAQQMGALEASVLELQGDVRESNEWSKKNHEALEAMAGFFEGMENLRKLANTLNKWGAPFLWLAGICAGVVGFCVAVVVFFKTGEWRP